MDDREQRATLLLDYWRILKRRRWILYTTLAVTLVVVAAGSLLQTPTYRATAVLQIERVNPNVLNFKDVLSVDQSYAAYQDFYQTQYKILETHGVARRTALALDLPNRDLPQPRRRNPIAFVKGWLSRLLSSRPETDGDDASRDPLDPFVDFVLAGLTVSPERNSHLVNLSFASRDPRLAAAVANTHAEAYIAYNLEAKFDTAHAATQFLENQIVAQRQEIAELDAALQEYGLDENAVALADQQEMVLKSMSDVSEQLTEAQLRRAGAQARLNALEEGDPESLTEVRESPLLRDLKARDADLDRQIAQVAQRFGPSWPELTSLRAERERLETRIVTQTEEIVHRVKRAAEAEYLEASEEQRVLEGLLGTKKGEAQRLNRESVEYSSLQAEVEKKRALLAQLLERRSETLVSTQLKDSGTSNIRIVQRATVPLAPFRPNIPRNLFLGVLFGLFAGLGLAFLLEQVDSSLRTPEEVERALGLPTLASVATLASGKEEGDSAGGVKDLVAWKEPRAPQSEAFRDLRTALLLSAPAGAPPTMLVTSSNPQEGKSFTALNLGIVLAQLGKKVLLVDGDLRRPRLHVRFEAENRAGLSTVLSGNGELGEMIQATRVPGLSVLTAGPLPPNPSELLDSDAFASLLADLERSEFAHIVFDSPPLLSVTDPQILARRAAATVMVIKAGSTLRDSAVRSLERLRKAKAHVVGVVLNQMSDAESRYYYRYYEGGRQEPADDGGPTAAGKRRLARSRLSRGEQES